MTASRSGLVRLVADREIAVKLRDKGFLASTAVFIAVIVLAVVVPVMLDGDSPEYTVATSEQARPVAEAAAKLGAADVQGLPSADLTIAADVAGRTDPIAALEDPEIDAALTLDAGGAVVITAQESVPGDLEELIAAASSAVTAQAVATDAGLSADQVAALTSPEAPRVDLLEPKPQQPVPPELVIIIFGFLFYFTVLTFGASIAQSVVEEKSSRVVEILVAAVPVRWLLAGKVLGNAAMALGQVVLIVGAGLLGAQAIGKGDIVTQVLGVSGWFLAFFVLGFLMLACLWAVAGSLASRVEELQSTTLYMQLAVMAPFFTAILIRDEGPLRVALSYFPLTAPLMMPARVATGDAAVWEPWVAVGIVAATAVALIAVGARLYAGSVLNTSARTRLGGAWAAGGRA
ncbi:ABC transporter permease [Demequina sp. SYSU T00192]|uniref:ABC transporter permease n=1 Tax=Demequina litoralis TaxID=3051660 RepID=A0ABT8GA11_9MICO|nr:ABC transporter permease [Demequina sp. SYSU T00192]MDN4475980.1 ABC transporter permease [Demequina sp. SYSU T00192]